MGTERGANIVEPGEHYDALERIEELERQVATLTEERDALKTQRDNLGSYIVEYHDPVNAIVPVSTLEAMGKMRDDLSAEAHELRCKLALVPPGLLAAALGKPHGDLSPLEARAEAAEREVATLTKALAPFADVWGRMVEDEGLFEPVANQGAYRAAWYAARAAAAVEGNSNG